MLLVFCVYIAAGVQVVTCGIMNRKLAGPYMHRLLIEPPLFLPLNAMGF